MKSRLTIGTAAVLLFAGAVSAQQAIRMKVDAALGQARGMLLWAALGVTGLALSAQQAAEKRGSDNLRVVSHLPLGGGESMADIEIEQDLSRPFVYVARQMRREQRGLPGAPGDRGLDILDISDPANPRVIHRWRIEDSDPHVGAGGKDIKTFEWGGRHYIVLSFQFGQGGPNADLGAIVFDVTGLPDVSTFREVARIQGPGELAGFHNAYVYRHSNGRALLFSTEYQYAPLRIFDLKPGLDGEVSNINEPIAAWFANPQNLVHNHEVRWPLVFVSAYRDGLQVFSMQDPKKPRTVAHYDTYLEPEGAGVTTGGWGVDVRNADGLIVLSDKETGFWAFRVEGFSGWNGLDHGMPNISSVQDWESGPAVQARTRR